MEQNTMTDYEFLEEHIKGDDVQKIADICDCSKATVYTYLGGKQSNVHLGKAIIDAGIKLLSDKGITKS